MIRSIAAMIFRNSPDVVVRCSARAARYLPRGERWAHFIADQGDIRGMPSVVIQEKPQLKLRYDDSRIVKICHYLGAGAWEPGEADLWRHLCSRSSNILEIGGNIGYFTVIGGAANTNANYHVVEPHPRNADSMRANVSLNRLENVKFTEAAVVGDASVKSIRLSVPAEETGRRSTGGYIDGAEGIDRPGTESFDVKTVLGSDIAPGIDLLKLDVEGAESAILSSMTGELAKSRPCIVLEVRRRTPRLRRWIKTFVTNNNYKIWHLGSPMGVLAVESIETVVLQESYGTRDVLLVPAGREHVLMGIHMG